jgi:hypothetical protein
MSRIDELPADRRAVLQLLLKQGKSYDELSSLLRIDGARVRERAHAALDDLGPSDGAGLAFERQEELSDYLLGQLSPSESDSTRDLLEESAAARAWARIVSGELRSIPGATLPEIPADRADRVERDEPAAVSPSRAPRERQPREAQPAGAKPSTSRLGGLLLLAAVGIAIAVVLIFVVGGGSDDKNDNGSSASRTQSTQTSSAQPQVLGQINLNAPTGSGSKALAALTLVRQGAETDLLFQGQGLPPNQAGDVYALWVTGPGGRAARLGFMPRVGKSGKTRFPGALPSNVDLSKYDTLLMTRETTASPTQPGAVVLRGKLPGAS